MFILRQSGHSRRWQGADKWLGRQCAHRAVAGRLARHGRYGAAKADLRRFAKAALGRRAVHPDGRVLAGDGVPQAPDGHLARLLRDLLWRTLGLVANRTDVSQSSFSVAPAEAGAWDRKPGAQPPWVPAFRAHDEICVRVSLV